ncbi:MAG: winged helix-turn-helix domain-containing protein [Promethearchaeota archaeon]
MLGQNDVTDHSTRRKILRKLSKDKAFLREIAKDLDIPTSTAAYHLKRLTQNGLLLETRGVYHVFYRLSEKGRELVEDTVGAI